jgi:hypothetical protein
MNVQRLIDHRSTQMRKPPSEKRCSQHIKIARIDDIGGGQTLASGDGQTGPTDYGADTLGKSSIICTTEINLFTPDRGHP